MIVVTDPTTEPDMDTNNNRKERSSASQSDVLETQVLMLLPPGLAPADIAEIRVCTTNQNVLLSGKPPRENPSARRSKGT